MYVPAVVNTETGEVHERTRSSARALQPDRQFTAIYRDSAGRLSLNGRLRSRERLLFLIQSRVQAHGHVHLKPGELAAWLGRDQSTVNRLVADFREEGILLSGSTATSLKVSANLFDYAGPGPRTCKRCPDDFLRLTTNLGKRSRQDDDDVTSEVLA